MSYLSEWQVPLNLKGVESDQTLLKKFEH